MYKLKFFIAFFYIVVLGMNICNGRQVTINPEANRKDFSPIFAKHIKDFLNDGVDNELIIYVNPGKYPIASSGYFPYNGTGKKTIKIIGKSSAKSSLALLYNPASVTKPIAFFRFEGTLIKPTNFEIQISNLKFQGNNVPYSAQHPFFGNKAIPETCLLFSNTYTFKLKNIEILNFYGNGIVADNTYSNDHDKKFMIQSPIMDNVRILNSWSQNFLSNSGTGILIGYSKNPQIINCEIFNNLLVTKYYGFVALDLETRTDGAIIRNNKFGGYHTLIHAECTYGGHSISTNTFQQSYIGVNISEDCSQLKSRKSLYRPIVISNNSFFYDNEYDKIKQGTGDWGFISVYKSSFALEGLQIVNNKFKVGKNKISQSQLKGNNNKLYSDKKVYLNLQNQQEVTVKGNVYE